MTTVGSISVVVEGKDVSLSKILADVRAKMKESGSAADEFSDELAKISPAQEKAEASALRHAQTLARVQSTAGNTTQAINTLATALSKVTPNTNASNRALIQLQQTINKAGKTAENKVSALSTFGKGVNSMTDGIGRLDKKLNDIGGALSGSFAVAAVAAGVSEVINLGNSLEKTEASVRALAGSQEFYNEILQLAKDRQDKFGGSLEESLRGFGQFANLSKRTGIEIEFLTGAAQRLAAIDPAQGLEGAAIALKEFFSGDITSLVERFEMPRGLLNSIKDMEDPIERARALDQVLNELGATQELLDNQAATTAATYDKLSGSFTNLGAAIGQGLAQTLEPAAAGLAAFFQAGADGAMQLINAGAQVQAYSDTILTSAQSYDAYIAKVNEVNSQLSPLTGYVTELTAAQYEYAQSLLASGTSIAEVNELLQQNGGHIAAIENITTQMRDGFSATDAELAAFVSNLMYLSTTSEQAAIYAEDLAFSVATGGASFEDASFAIQVQVDALRQHAEATAKAEAEAAKLAAQQTNTKDATAEYNKILAEKIQTSLAAQQQDERLKQMQQELEAVSYQVANGFASSAQAATHLASQYGITTDAAYQLVKAQVELAKLSGQEYKGTSLGQGGDSIDEYRAFRLRKTPPVKPPEETKPPKATGSGGRAGKGGGGGRAAKGKADKEAEQLRKAEEKLQEDLQKISNESHKKLLENDKKYKEAQLRIYADYNKKLAEQEKKNEVSKRYSRVDFYDSLANATDEGIDASKYAAEYEKAFQEAQEMSQRGEKKLADEYLKMRTDHINALKELDKEAASIQNDVSLSDSEKRDRLAYLEGRRQLREDAQREELQALIDAGDDLNNELADQLNSEALAYEDSKNQIIQTAKDQADERIRESDRATDKIIDNARREREAIAGLPSTSTSDLNSNKPTPSLPPTTATTSDTSLPLPQYVIPSGVMSVQDTLLNTTLTDFATMSEAKLQAVIDSINRGTGVLSAKISNLDNSVRSLRSGNTTLVQ